MNNPFLYLANQATFKDRYDTKMSHFIKQWDGSEKVSYGIIGLPLSKSSISFSGAFQAPRIIRELFSNYTSYIEEDNMNLNTMNVRDMGDILMHPNDILISHHNIQEGLSMLYQKQKSMIPILLGGDHSVTGPSVKAFKKKINGNVGIIQFDAHHDIRNLEDGGPTNGTPFRTLIEQKIISPKNLVQIGIRNYSNSSHYANEAKELGIKVFTMSDVQKIPIEEVLREAISVASKGTDSIYVTIDIDVLDQVYAPGAVSIGPGGMTSERLLKAIYLLSLNTRVQALDIVCIDPTQDFRHMTSRLGVHFILEFLRGKHKETNFQ